MNKKTKYAINGAIFAGVGNAVLNAINQLNEIEKNPNQKFDWNRFFIALAKGAVVGGGSGFVIGAWTDYQNSLEKPVRTDAFLYKIIDDVKLNTNEAGYIKLSQKAEGLIALLNSHFYDRLKSYPKKGGSTESGTALKSKFDIDVFLCFKSNSFISTQKMFYAVLSFLENQKEKYAITEIRDQKKSIGLIFSFFGKEYKIDIVPYKITAGSRSSGYLYKNEKSLWRDNSSYTKTDIKALNNLTLTPTQQKITILLKNWKLKNDIPLSSHLLQNLILDAYDRNCGKIPKGFTKKVIMVLKHIKENLNVAVIRSVENTNNILTNISEDKKQQIIDACAKAIEEYEYQPNSIVSQLNQNQN